MLGDILKEVVTWTVCALCAVATFFYYDELKTGMAHALGMPHVLAGSELRAAPDDAPVKPSSGGVELRAGRNGHFETIAEVNGRQIEVMVDTGATLVALSYEDAERAGIYVKDSDYTQRASTANGTVRMAPVMLDRVTIGDITVRNVRASVAERGRQSSTLLGMTFLSKLSRTEMRGGVLVLYE